MRQIYRDDDEGREGDQQDFRSRSDVESNSLEQVSPAPEVAFLVADDLQADRASKVAFDIVPADASADAAPGVAR